MTIFVKWTIVLFSLAAVITAVYILLGRDFFKKPNTIAFTFEINAITPGTYDAQQEILNQEYPMPANQSEVTINYTLKNKINTLPGRISATIGGSSLLSSGSFPNIVNIIPANTNFTSEFHGWAFPPGKHTLTLTYTTPRTIKSPVNIPDSIIAQATFDYIVPQGITDNDSDFVDDGIEHQLLQTYRPYYRFSLQGRAHLPKSSINPGFADENRPIDVLSFIKFSQMLTTDEESDPPIITNILLADRPSRVVFDAGAIGPSDITKAPKQTNYYIDPIPNPRGAQSENPARDGATWDAVMQLKNIGLYGHVVPITLKRIPETGILDYHKDSIPSGALDSANLFYKIEYWQFYGYNNCHCGIDAAHHEGDWTTVQLLYNPREDAIEAVFFYEHGKVEFRYDMNQTIAIVPLTNPRLAGNFRQHQGVNFNNINKNAELVRGRNIQQFAVEFFQDPITGKWTHPVAYIEIGGHEPWPTSDFRFAIQPNHDGDDYEHCFLTETIPNLGEVEHPMKWDGAKEILNFNGNWGANYGGARGPCTHTQWTWPSNSSIRWLIPELTN